MSPPMITAPLTDLSQALAAKRLSSVELVEGLLARIDRGNGRLNAFLTIDRERALGAARSAHRHPDRAQGRHHDRGVEDDLRLADAGKLRRAVQRVCRRAARDRGPG